MDDFISRRFLLAEYDRVHVGEPGKARKLMEDAPSVDAVEVVRCKDCKHWEAETGFCDKHSQFNCDEMCWDMFEEDDFCSYGERKKTE